MERRNTIQKELVLNAVMRMRRHVTAEEVYDFIRSEYSSIGKGTVYRNLALLAEENRIRRVGLPNGSDRYDFRLQKHYHLRCVKCGRLFDVDMDELGELESRVHNESGMVFLDYDILFRGICPDCPKTDP